MFTDRGEKLFAIWRHEEAAEVGIGDERLVHVPTTREVVTANRWTTHECCLVAMTTGRMPNRSPNQNGLIGDLEPDGRLEGQLDLARSVFDLDGGRRHAEFGQAAPERFEDRLQAIETFLA